jgi:DNA-binding CsgD family transcriptional regulator
MTRQVEKFASLHALPISSALIDASGRIVAVNEAWKTFGERNGLCLPDFGVGANYFNFCQTGEERDGGIAKQLMELLDGRSDIVTTIYPCHSPTQQRWFLLVGLPLSTDRPTGVAIVHADLTSLLTLPSGLATAVPEASILGAIEQSVTNTLAKQLRVMFEGPSDNYEEDIDPRSKLSQRQLEVLKLLGEGKSNAEIASALFRSQHTVKLHVSEILKRLNLKSRTQAALLASKLLDGA